MVSGRVAGVGGAVEFGEGSVDRGQSARAGAQAARGELVGALGGEAHGEGPVGGGQHADGEAVAPAERRRRVGRVGQTDQDHRRLQRHRAERAGRETSGRAVLAARGHHHDTGGETGHRGPEILGRRSGPFGFEYVDYVLTLRHDGAPPVGPHGRGHRGFSSLGTPRMRLTDSDRDRHPGPDRLCGQRGGAATGAAARPGTERCLTGDRAVTSEVAGTVAARPSDAPSALATRARSAHGISPPPSRPHPSTSSHLTGPPPPPPPRQRPRPVRGPRRLERQRDM